jgi:hypothetical protein
MVHATEGIPAMRTLCKELENNQIVTAVTAQQFHSLIQVDSDTGEVVAIIRGDAEVGVYKLYYLQSGNVHYYLSAEHAASAAFKKWKEEHRMKTAKRQIWYDGTDKTAWVPYDPDANENQPYVL